MFVLKFMAITNVLVTNGVMSAADRVMRLLEGLDEGMRIKVIKLCTQKGWKITDEDSGECPKFDEIKKFLDDEAKTNERFAVYARDHTLQVNPDIDDVKTILHSASTTGVGSPMPAAMDSAIQTLTEQMAALTLLLNRAYLVAIWRHLPPLQTRFLLLLRLLLLRQLLVLIVSRAAFGAIHASTPIVPIVYCLWKH